MATDFSLQNPNKFNSDSLVCFPTYNELEDGDMVGDHNPGTFLGNTVVTYDSLSANCNRFKTLEGKEVKVIASGFHEKVRPVGPISANYFLSMCEEGNRETVAKTVKLITGKDFGFSTWDEYFSQKANPHFPVSVWTEMLRKGLDVDSVRDGLKKAGEEEDFIRESIESVRSDYDDVTSIFSDLMLLLPQGLKDEGICRKDLWDLPPVQEFAKPLVTQWSTIARLNLYKEDQDPDESLGFKGLERTSGEDE